MANLDEKTGKPDEGSSVNSAGPKVALPPPEEKQPSPPSPSTGPSPSTLSSFAESFPSPPSLPSTPEVSDFKPEIVSPPPFPPKSPQTERILPSSVLSEGGEAKLSPRGIPFSAGETPPPPKPSSFPEEENPLPTAVKVGHSKPFILKLLIFLLGLGFLGALIFAGWKFVFPFLPVALRPGGVTLTYWGLWEEENVLKPLIDEYEKSHRGIKIDYKKQNPQEYRERVQAAIDLGKGPDIFRFHNTWLPMLKKDLSPVPSSVFSSGDFQKTFYPVAAKDLKQGDSFYGIPLEIDGLALLSNADIFEAAGISPPTTWEDFQKAARTLTVKDEKGRIQTAGVALGTTNNVDNWSDILALMFLQNGVDLKNPQGKLAEDAMIFYTSFAQGENKAWDETLPPSTLAFAQGKAAMIFAPSWQILAIKAQNPRLNFKVLTVPQLPGTNITWASYWVEGVPLKSSHQAEAWEFVKYLSQKETLVKFYTEAAKTRLFGEPYGRQDLSQSLKDDPYLGPYIRQVPYAQSFYLTSRTFDNGINDKIIKYFEDAVNAVNRGLGPRSALETAAQGTQQVLSTYGVAVPTPTAK